MHTELLVLGGGPGGYAAAFAAADAGLDVTLVDAEPNPGGVCLFRGCIPSKALLHVAKVIDEARRAADLGVWFGAPEIDLERLSDWREEVVQGLTRGLGGLAKQRDVRHVRAWGTFDGPHRLALDDGETLTFERAILATGSTPAALPGLPFDHPRVWDSADALALPRLPDRLLVVGGGYIGLEMATVYAALGSEVIVVEATEGLLPGVDRELVAPLEKALRRRVAVHLETKAQVELADDGVVARIGEGSERFDAVLVAVGRRPRTDDMGLHRTRAEVGPDGFVVTDDRGRTAEHHIYAIGDCTSQPMLAHKATHEGIAVARALAGDPAAAFDPAAIPAVVFTDPEVAWTGLMEDEARAKGLDVEVTRFPWSASGRARTLARRDGLTKLVFERPTGRLLGAGIVGADAGELVAEATLAIEMAATATDLARTIHPHPTLGETLMEAAEMAEGQSTHYLPRRAR